MSLLVVLAVLTLEMFLVRMRMLLPYRVPGVLGVLSVLMLVVLLWVWLMKLLPLMLVESLLLTLLLVALELLPILAGVCVAIEIVCLPMLPALLPGLLASVVLLTDWLFVTAMAGLLSVIGAASADALGASAASDDPGAEGAADGCCCCFCCCCCCCCCCCPGSHAPDGTGATVSSQVKSGSNSSGSASHSLGSQIWRISGLRGSRLNSSLLLSTPWRSSSSSREKL
mmetsp:Transcript_78051/g.140817  ORF Transcript_78051/g.140817 Transcript_78051/m.140817 type:complete len:227 (-) Transcript_78051:1129-1809(-)